MIVSFAIRYLVVFLPRLENQKGKERDYTGEGNRENINPLLTLFFFFASYEHHSINEPAILLGGAFII